MITEVCGMRAQIRPVPDGIYDVEPCTLHIRGDYRFSRSLTAVQRCLLWVSFQNITMCVQCVQKLLFGMWGLLNLWESCSTEQFEHP